MKNPARRAGVRHVEVNAHGRTIRALGHAGGAGDDLHLAICADLQAFLTKRMEGHSGSAIIMDIETGELLSLVRVLTLMSSAAV